MCNSYRFATPPTPPPSTCFVSAVLLCYVLLVCWCVVVLMCCVVGSCFTGLWCFVVFCFVVCELSHMVQHVPQMGPKWSQRVSKGINLLMNLSRLNYLGETCVSRRVFVLIALLLRFELVPSGALRLTLRSPSTMTNTPRQSLTQRTVSRRSASTS